MFLFILGLAVFFSAHFFTAFARDGRRKLVQRLGDRGYKGLYSLVSLGGFVLIIAGWGNADASLVYSPPAYLRHVTYLLMPISFILLTAAYVPAGRIALTVKHPMLAGVKIWAFAHLLSNGEVRSVILFGAFLAFAVADRIALKRREEPGRAAGPMQNDIMAIIIGLIAFAGVAFYLHQYIAGVALF